MNRRRILRLLMRGVVVALLLLFGGYLWSVRADFLQALRGLHAVRVAEITGLLVGQWGLRAWRDHLLYSAAGSHVGVGPLLWMNNVQLTLNHLPLKAGTLASAGLLLSRFGIPLGRFAATVSRQLLLNIVASSVIGAVAVWFSSAGTGVPTQLLFVVLTAAAVGASTMLVWHRPILASAGLIPRDGDAEQERLLDGAAGWAHHGAVGALTVGVSLVAATRVSVVFATVGAPLGMADALVIAAALMLSPLVAITPGGIGVTEALVGLTASLVDQAGRLGVIAATLDRLLILATSALLAVAMAPWALRTRRPR